MRERAHVERQPLLRRWRARAVRKRFELEPEWRRPTSELQTGYEAKW